MAARRRLDAGDDALLIELVAAIGAGHIQSGAIIDDDDEADEVVYGICESVGTVVVDEAVCRSEVLLHEVLHRMRPRWSEAKVNRTAARIFRRLSREQIEAIDRVYLGVRKSRKRPKVI